MKSIVVGIIAGLLVATAVSAYQAEEHKGGSPMGGMMQGMKGMMGRMTKMMDMCSQMMGNRSEPKKAESSK